MNDYFISIKQAKILWRISRVKSVNKQTKKLFIKLFQATQNNDNQLLFTDSMSDLTGEYYIFYATFNFVQFGIPQSA